MVEVGDRVVVESEKVGSVTRSGVVTAVEDRLITVRWDSGSESVFVPSAGFLQVTGHEPPQGMRATPEVAGRGVDAPPRLGRLGSPILTMDQEPSAVLTRVVAGRAAPSTAKLWASCCCGGQVHRAACQVTSRLARSCRAMRSATLTEQPRHAAKANGHRSRPPTRSSGTS